MKDTAKLLRIKDGNITGTKIDAYCFTAEVRGER